MIDDLIAGRIDATVLWGPIAGYDAKHSDPPLTVVLLSKEHGVPMDFRISIGARHSDQNSKRKSLPPIAKSAENLALFESAI
jgi:hypothetical protein